MRKEETLASKSQCLGVSHRGAIMLVCGICGLAVRSQAALPGVCFLGSLTSQPPGPVLLEALTWGMRISVVQYKCRGPKPEQGSEKHQLQGSSC